MKNKTKMCIKMKNNQKDMKPRLYYEPVWYQDRDF